MSFVFVAWWVVAETTSVGIWLVANVIAACMFAGLSVLLIASSLKRLHGWLLTAACTMNALWCGLLAVGLVVPLGGLSIDIVELIRDWTWLIFVVWLIPVAAGDRWKALLRWGAFALPGLLLTFLVWRVLVAHGALVFQHRTAVFTVAATFMSLAILVLIEQIYRAADLEKRWAIKYICLGVGALFAYDFFMYSFALTHQHVDLAMWEARAAVNALIVPLIAVSIGRNPSWSPNLRLSHQAAFHTGTIFICGGYLLVMSATGYYMRNFGGSWSGAIGVLVQVVITLSLLILLLSGQVRARAKVLIKKNFFQYKYDYRAEWLGLTQRLSHAGEVADPYQRSIRAVAHILEAPAGALWLNREGAYVCASTWNMGVAGDIVEPHDTLFASFLRDRYWIIDLAEYERVPSHYGELELPAWLADIPKARLIMPLFFEQQLLGFMLLAEPRVRYALTWEDLDVLKTLGTQVGGFLGQQESNQALAEARQFEAVNHLTAFLMHDLKNIANQQSLIVQNARKHKRNPDFVDDMIMTVDSSVDRMKRLLAQLQRTTEGTDETRRVEVGSAVKRVIESLSARSPEPVFDTSQSKAFVRVNPDRFEMIVGHIIRNAQEATNDEGRISVRLTIDETSVCIAVEDNGSGMTPAFVRESLFKPFFTTKSTRGMGIGAYQVRDFARAAGGHIDVTSIPGQGTTFKLVLPAFDSSGQSPGRLAEAVNR